MASFSYSSPSSLSSLSSPSILNYGHSSVISLPTGQLLELRRGTLRDFAIPNPYVWCSIQDWYSHVPYIQFDTLQRYYPTTWSYDQMWTAQWFEQSTLLLEDMNGCWTMMPDGKPPILLIADSITGQLYPLYMNLDTGAMYLNRQYFTSYSQLNIHVGEVWRYEYGVYYRIY